MRATRLAIAMLGTVILGGAFDAVRAQGPRPGRVKTWHIFPNELIDEKAVQQELHLTNDQIRNYTLLVDEFRAAMFARIKDARLEAPNFKIVSEMERNKKCREYDAKTAELLKDVRATFELKFSAILSAGHLERLRQIDWQRLGVHAYRAPLIAEAIGLSDAQRDELEAIWNDAQQALDALARSAGAITGSPDVPKTLENMKSIFRKRDAKLAGVVTANQRGLFVKRQGKPFDFTGVRAAEDVLLRSEPSASQVK
jgi:hypothetical protein